MSGTRPLACPPLPSCDSPRFEKQHARQGAVRSTVPHGPYGAFPALQFLFAI